MISRTATALLVAVVLVGSLANLFPITISSPDEHAAFSFQGGGVLGSAFFKANSTRSLSVIVHASELNQPSGEALCTATFPPVEGLGVAHFTNCALAQGDYFLVISDASASSASPSIVYYSIGPGASVHYFDGFAWSQLDSSASTLTLSWLASTSPTPQPTPGLAEIGETEPLYMEIDDYIQNQGEANATNQSTTTPTPANASNQTIANQTLVNATNQTPSNATNQTTANQTAANTSNQTISPSSNATNGNASGFVETSFDRDSFLAALPEGAVTRANGAPFLRKFFSSPEYKAERLGPLVLSSKKTVQCAIQSDCMAEFVLYNDGGEDLVFPLEYAAAYSLPVSGEEFSVATNWTERQARVPVTTNSNESSYANETQLDYSFSPSQVLSVPSRGSTIFQLSFRIPDYSRGDFNLTLSTPFGALEYDPSVISGCGPITLSDYYTVRSNISGNGNCLDIRASDVEIHCDPAVSISGNGSGYGVYVDRQSNVSVINCEIKNFSTGVYYFGDVTDNCALTDNTVWNNSAGGFYLEDGDHNAYSSNNVSYNRGSGFNFTGSATVNTVEGSTVMYNTNGLTVNSDSDSADNLVIYNNKFAFHTKRGITSTDGDSNNYSYNNVSYNTEHGIYFLGSTTLSNVSWNDVVGNGADSGSYHGVYLDSDDADYNTFDNNSVSDSGGVEVYLASGDSNVFYNNSIAGDQCVNLSATADSNAFYHNYLSKGTLNNFVYNGNSTNNFNTTVGSVYQGNYYNDISSYAIYDSDSDGFGDTGPDYPYDSDMAYWFGEGADYGPIGANETVKCQVVSADLTLNVDVHAQDYTACFNLTANGVTLDCAGHTVYGSGAETGVFVKDTNDTRVENCVFAGLNYGVRVDPSYNNTVIDSVVYSSGVGLWLQSSHNNTIQNVTVFNSTYYGIVLNETSDYNTVYNTTSWNNTLYGIHLNTGNYNNFSYNNVSYNRGHGVYLVGTCTNNHISWNNVTRNSVGSNSYNGIDLYSETADYNTVDHNTVDLNGLYGIRLVSADYNNVSYNNAGYNIYYGVYLGGPINNNNISWNNVTGNLYDGILFDSDTADLNTIDHNTVTLNGRYGVYLANADYNNCSYNNISYNTQHGVYLAGTATNNNISWNNVTGNSVGSTTYDGIDLGGVSATYNTIDNNLVEDNSVGITVYLGEYNIVFSNTVTGNRIRGIRFWDSNYNNASYNNASYNTKDGIFLVGSATNNNISWNNVIGNLQYGINFDADTADYNIIFDNSIKDNWQSGIRVNDGDFNNISYNNVSYNAQHGVYLSSTATYNNISWNNVTGNSVGSANYDGINWAVDTVDNNTVSFNTVNNNGRAGIKPDYGDYNVFYANNASYNAMYGIYAYGDATNNNISRNYFERNTGIGVVLYLDTCDSNTVYNNTIRYNSIYGVDLYAGDYNNISYNNVSYNTQHGIVLFDSATNNNVSWNNVTGNSVGSTSYHGIYLNSDDADYNALDHNTVSDNGGFGLHLNSGDYNNFSYNNFSYNTQYGVYLAGTATNNNISWNNITNNSAGSMSYYGLYLYGDDVDYNTIRGNTIYANGFVGVRLYASDYNNFSYNNFSYNHETNFMVESSATNNNLSFNYIHDSRTGMGLFFNSGTSDNNTVDNNKFYSNAVHGVYSAYCKRNVIRDNEVYSNGQRGIYLIYNADNHTLYNNWVHDNAQPGIEVTSCNYSNVSYNNVSYNIQHGIYLSGITASNNISWNNVTGNSAGSATYYGVYLNGVDVDGNTIDYNTIDFTGKYGVYVSNADENVFYRNNVSYSGSNGINLVTTAQDNNLSNNWLDDNGLHGIYLAGNDVDRNTVYDNTIVGSSQYGINIYAGDYNNMSYNNVSYNGRGLYLQDTATFNNVTGNLVVGCPYFGLYLGHSTTNYNTINDNTFEGDLHGAYVGSSSFNNFSYNNFSYNTQHGFYLYQDNNNTLHDNLMTWNTQSGVYFNGVAGDDNVSYNNLSYNTQHGVYLAGTSTNNNISWNNITGNSVGSTSYNGIYSDNEAADYNTVYSNNISFNRGHGIYLLNSDYWNISSNTISNQIQWGIVIIPSDGHYVYNNTIYNNSYGLNIYTSSSNNLVYSNNISHIGGVGLFSGITTGVGNNFSYNTIHNCGNNLQIGGGSSETFQGNTVYGALNHMFYLQGGNNHTITGNNFSYGPTGTYIVSGATSNNTISGNTFHNLVTGFYLNGSSYNNFTGNSFYSNTGNGVTLTDEQADYNLFYNNSFYLNALTGFSLTAGDYNNVSYNNLSYNTQYGFLLAGTSTNNNISWNNVTGNSVGSNTYDGIRINSDTTDYNTIDHNTVDFNRRIGISINNGDYNNVSYNNASYTPIYHGVYLEGSADYNNISWNSLHDNSDNGLQVKTNYNTVNNNSIRGNGVIGLEVYGGTYNSVYNNSINETQCFNATADASYNSFYHNYLYGGSNNFVGNANETNDFNTTVEGVAQGNYYEDILDWAIYDADSDGFGESGYEYPYDSDMTYWFGSGADYGPMDAATQVSCRTISGNLTLFNNVAASGDCFVIGAGNIWLDCDGYSITGDETGEGVNNTGYENVTVKNCFIQNFSEALHWNSADYGRFRNDTLYDNAYGARFLDSNNASIWDSNASYDSSYGLLFNSGVYGEVVNSTLSGSGKDLGYDSGGECLVLNSTFSTAEFLDADSNHSVAWFIDFYSVDSEGGAVASAELNLSTNAWWNSVWSGTTNATGGSGGWLNITSYFEDTNGVTNYSQHLMRAFKSDYLSRQEAVDTSTPGAKQVVLSDAFTRAFGDSIYNVTLADDGGDAVFNWSAVRAHAFAYDYDFAVNWSGLQALGRNATGEAASNDLAEADATLGLTGYLDSLSNSYGSETQAFTLYGYYLENVPVANSSNSSSLLTGILWDASAGGEYDGSQDLVFVAPILLNAQGLSGIVDYELTFPANLSNCSGAANQVSLELRVS